jgi:hypothetical protein
MLGVAVNVTCFVIGAILAIAPGLWLRLARRQSKGEPAREGPLASSSRRREAGRCDTIEA